MADEFKDDALNESTAASVGGLARMADSLVWNVMNRLNGGDFMTDPTRAEKVQQALAIAGHLSTFVDHLFDRLVREHWPAVVSKRELTVKVPPLVAQAAEAVDADRARRRAEQRETGTIAEGT